MFKIKRKENSCRKYNTEKQKMNITDCINDVIKVKRAVLQKINMLVVTKNWNSEKVLL